MLIAKRPNSSHKINFITSKTNAKIRRFGAFNPRHLSKEKNHWSAGSLFLTMMAHSPTLAIFKKMSLPWMYEFSLNVANLDVLQISRTRTTNQLSCCALRPNSFMFWIVHGGGAAVSVVFLSVKYMTYTPCLFTNWTILNEGVSLVISSVRLSPPRSSSALKTRKDTTVTPHSHNARGCERTPWSRIGNEAVGVLSPSVFSLLFLFYSSA